MIFEALQSELFRFKFHSLASNILKFPEFNLSITIFNNKGWMKLFLPPWEEWADLAGTAIASQPVRWAEQAPNYISSSKNQGDNRRRM